MRIIIVWVKAWSSKCLVAGVGVASGNISRILRPEELRRKGQKKTQNSKGKQIRTVVRVCVFVCVCVCVWRERERGSDYMDPMLESRVKRCGRMRGLWRRQEKKPHEPDLNIRGKWVIEEEEEQSERTGFLTEIGEGTVIPITLFPCLLLLPLLQFSSMATPLEATKCRRMWCPFCRSSYEESGTWVWRMRPYIPHQTRTSSLWPPPWCRRGPIV